VADHPMSFYAPPNNGIMAGGNFVKKYPFPGNGVGKIWMCPSIQLAGPDMNASSFLMGGQFGFFSYVMDLDLKLKTSINNGVLGNEYTYPNMPRLSTLRNTSSQVLLTEFCFSPTLENWTGSSQPQMGAFPSARFTYFPKRHNSGGNIVFTDGHSARFKFDYVYTTGRVELMRPDIWWNPNRDKQ